MGGGGTEIKAPDCVLLPAEPLLSLSLAPLLSFSPPLSLPFFPLFPSLLLLSLPLSLVSLSLSLPRCSPHPLSVLAVYRVSSGLEAGRTQPCFQREESENSRRRLRDQSPAGSSSSDLSAGSFGACCPLEVGSRPRCVSCGVSPLR